jgi:hypothetical protein
MKKMKRNMSHSMIFLKLMLIYHKNFNNKIAVLQRILKNKEKIGRTVTLKISMKRILKKRKKKTLNQRMRILTQILNHLV